MALVAAIDSATNITTWSRVVSSLAAILEHICLSVSPESLTLLAVNSSRTTHGEIVFDRGFFHDYELQTELDASENDQSAAVFSVVVASKHMLVLFKNLDAHNLNYVCLQMNRDSNTPVARRNKLLVEVLTKKLLVKKYHISFLPVEYTAASTVGTKYKAEVQEGRGNFYMMETAIMKQFFDMVPLGAEDFSLDVKTAKILFGAYTKQVVRDREYLKQPMLMTISLAVNELMDTNLGEANVSLSFRLKDFRNFIALCVALKLDLGESEYYGTDPHYEAYFQSMGDPIFFESRAQHLVVRFIQFTADDNGGTEKKYVLPAPAIVRAVRATMTPEAEAPRKNEKRKRQDQSGVGTKRAHPEKTSILPNPNYSDRSPQRADYDEFSPFEEGLYNVVTYGRRSRSPEKTPPALANEADTDYSASDTEQQLGPTQMTNKPKSLFE